MKRNSIDIRRRWLAWLLLAVFIVTRALMAFHTYEETRFSHTECNACVQHAPTHLHEGHLGMTGHHCLLCEMSSLPYVVATVLLFVPCQRFVYFLKSAVRRTRLQLLTYTVPHRGPPALLA